MNAITLLQSAVMLLTMLLSLGNNASPELRAQVIMVANQAVAEANTELLAASSTPVINTNPSHMGDDQNTSSTGNSTPDAPEAPVAADLQVLKAVYEQPNPDEGDGDDLYLWMSGDFAIDSVTVDGEDVSHETLSTRDMSDSCTYIGEQKICGGTAKRIGLTPAASTYAGKTVIVTASGNAVSFAI